MRRFRSKTTIHHAATDAAPAFGSTRNHSRLSSAPSVPSSQKPEPITSRTSLRFQSLHRPSLPFLRRHTLRLRSSTRGLRLFVLPECPLGPAAWFHHAPRIRKRSGDCARPPLRLLALALEALFQILARLDFPPARLVERSHDHGLAITKARVVESRQPHRHPTPRIFPLNQLIPRFKKFL